MVPDVTVDLGPRHCIRIRRPHIPGVDFEAKYGGYVALLTAVLVMVGLFVRVDRVLFLATHVHATLGDREAQYLLGQHYVQGHGVARNVQLSMDWFKKAADQGHPQAAYNLSYGHIRRLHTLLSKGDAEPLMAAAADAGMEEAKHAIKYFCSNGFCSM